MTESELFTSLKLLGIPVAHTEFKRKVAPPYLIYFIESETERGADESENLILEKNWVVELYTTSKDTVKENSIAEILKNYQFYKNSYYDGEFYVTVFEFTEVAKI